MPVALLASVAGSPLSPRGRVFLFHRSSAVLGSMLPSGSVVMRPALTALTTAVWDTPRMRAYSRRETPIFGLLGNRKLETFIFR